MPGWRVIFTIEAEEALDRLDKQVTIHRIDRRDKIYKREH